MEDTQLSILEIDNHLEAVESAEQAARLAEAEAAQVESWALCWGWDGPKVGGFGQVNTPIVSLVDSTDSLYCYMERVRFIEESEDGAWIAELDPLECSSDLVQSKAGTRLRLGIMDIWPPTRELRTEH